MSRIHIMDTVGTEIFVRTLANAEGLRVIFSDNDDAQPYTDPVNKLIHVAKPKWHWGDEQYNCWLGAVCHELGHHRGKNAEMMQYFVAKSLDTRSLYGKVINILMDWVNDAQWVGYPGAHNAVQAIQLRCATRALPMLRANPPKNDEDILMCGVFSWIYNRRAATYQKGLMPAAIEWARLIPHDLDKYNSELLELLVGDAKAIEELANKIVPSGPDKDEEEQEDGEGESVGESGDGEDSEGEESGEGTSGPESDGKDKGEIPSISYADVLISHDHSNWNKPSNTVVVYDHDWSNSYVPIGRYKEINLEEECK